MIASGCGNLYLQRGSRSASNYQFGSTSCLSMIPLEPMSGTHMISIIKSSMSQTSLRLRQNGTKRRAFLLGNLNQANKSRKLFYQMTDYYIFILLEKARGLLPSQ